MEFNFKSYDTSKQSISYCEVDKCNKVIGLNQQLDQLKAENEKLDTENKRLVAELANPVFDSFEELDKLKQTITEIKVFVMQAKHDYNLPKYLFDTILQKISECEVE